MGRPSKILTKEDILRAMKQTRSNMHAARVLHVSYNHYKKYAKMYKNDEGKTLLEAHMNQAGEGIPKFTVAGDKEIPLIDLLDITIVKAKPMFQNNSLFRLLSKQSV